MRPTADGTVDVVVRTLGGLSAPAADYARTRIGSVLHGVPGSFRGAEVRLERSRRTVPEQVLVRIAVDVGDGSVTVNVRGTGVREAVDVAAERLRVRLVRVHALRESARPAPARASA
jgi:hypothetical protein